MQYFSAFSLNIKKMIHSNTKMTDRYSFVRIKDYVVSRMSRT